MKIKSIKFKISVLYIFILGLVLVGYSSFLYVSLYNTLYAELRRELIEKTTEIHQGISRYLHILGEDEDSFLFSARRIITLKGEYPNPRKTLANEDKRTLVNFEKNWLVKYDRLDLRQDFIRLIDASGDPVVSSKNVSPAVRDVFGVYFKRNQPEEVRAVSFGQVKFKERDLMVVQSPVSFAGHPGYFLQIATSQAPVVGLLRQRQTVFLISLPVLLLLASFGGGLLVSRSLKPVHDITQIARQITHQDLSRRIKSQDIDTEMLTLVEAFNDMIGRLDKSFAHIAEFSSQVSHELKTPIAIIRGEVELALRKDRSAEEYRRVLDVCLDETRVLLTIVEDLLLLAKFDYRPEVFSFEPFDLKKFFQEIAEQSSILAAEKNVAVTLSLSARKATLSGDKIHLRRLFFNIIDNAIKFTPPQGRVKIAVRHAQDHVVATITDTGAGIPPGRSSESF